PYSIMRRDGELMPSRSAMGPGRTDFAQPSTLDFNQPPRDEMPFHRPRTMSLPMLTIRPARFPTTRTLSHTKLPKRETMLPKPLVMAFSMPLMALAAWLARFDAHLATMAAFWATQRAN